MRRIAVHKEASAEAEAAALWYDNERLGLGADFTNELNQALSILREGIVPGMPWRGTPGSRGVRYLTLKRFPFRVVFVGNHDAVAVLAVAHHSRKPAYWRDRLSSQ